jgi:hypothetical protein
MVFERFTKENAGKLMLVMIAGRPIVAHFIPPITTDHFFLEVVNESEAAELTVELQKMIKRK